MEVKQIGRKFKIQETGLELPDPNPAMTEEQVQQFYSVTYPQLTTATMEKVFDGESFVFTFKSVIGTKG
ncbi:PRTRC system protein C [Dysgonomonas sp. 25]|uniref:PRTRC system protein C n=1 Tax=Dysgonomonas sp. 25 TaxID=2302933 RepID=UPI0013D3E71D|nr:PRTRC system protein C [Dysgonomonas sp. 25]NDV69959.1 PRTRC system protein C [Dysgonomonas sp. 25]